MFKKLFLGLLVLVVLVAVGGTVYLNMIDWNQHKTVIAQQFSEATGKNVSFNGSVSFNILPSPSLEASDISVYNTDPNGKQVTLAKIQKLVSSLSLRSLIKGHINVEKMTVINPEIFIEGYENGTLNWQSGSGNNKDFSINNVEVSFGSVMLDNAKIHLINKAYNIDTTINNINAEVIAGSLFGPYRIEGSYIKEGTPGGFALDLGKFSESFATSVNAVISHPQSESYARFEGTVLLKNDAVNGNVTVESKNPVNFINSLFKKANISEDYEYPLAMSLAVKSDKSQIAISNIVVKYAGSAGAGNILIPRKETQIGESGMERRRIDAAFNMAEFNLEPVINLLQDFLKKYDVAEYIPEYNFDVIADLKAVKTTYKNQVIRDLDLSVDFMDNVVTVQNLTAQLPFDGIAKAKGELYSVEKVLTYNFDVEASSPDFAKTVNWLGYNLKPLTKNVYKRSSTKFTLAGTLKTIKAAPFILNVDKTAINGKLAMIRGKTNKYFVIIETDNINFDNYIADMPAEVAAADLESQINYRMKELAALSKLDLQFRTELNSGIWGKIPFEKLSVEGILKDEKLKLINASVGDVATAQMAMKGEISGFGGELQFKNVNYGIFVKDNEDFTERMKLSFPNAKLNNLVQFSSRGVVTGGLKRLAIKSTSKLGNIDNAYTGEISKVNGAYSLNGKLELRSNDFVRFLNDFSVDYKPEYPLGLFKMSANVKGTAEALLFKDMNVNIGANNFSGDLLYMQKDKRNLIKTNLNVNKFEFERFFYNTNTRAEASIFRPKNEKVPFLPQPVLSKAKINYDWCKDWDVEAKVNVGTLSLRNFILKNVSWAMALQKQVLKIAQFTGEKGEGLISADFVLNVPDQAKLSGKLNLNNINIEKDDWSGLTYGLTAGSLASDITFDTTANSVSEMMTQFSGTGSFRVEKPVVKGWKLGVIEADLDKRNVADGFKALVQNNLSRGETAFNEFTGDFKVDNGNFSIRNGIFDADTYKVLMSANGSLKNWDENATFSVTFKDIPNVASIDFMLDGNINAPSLDTDVSRVTDVYTAHLKKVAAEAKAAQDAKVKKYRDLMAEQQERAEKSKQRLDGTIMEEFKSSSSKTNDAKMKRYYASINKQIVEVNSNIGDVLSKRGMVDINDKVIASLKQQNDVIDEQMAKIERDLTSVRAQDVRLRIAQNSVAVAEKVSQAQKLPTALLEANGKFGERLVAISSNYNLDKDEEAKALSKKLEETVATIDTLGQQVSRDNVVARSIMDIETLDKYATNFENANKTVTKNLNEAVAMIKKYQDSVNSKVSAEEQRYSKQQSDAAIQQKINENSGRITTAGGRTEIVERNIEQIRRSEEAIRQQGSQVLDFSDDASSGGKIIIHKD